MYILYLKFLAEQVFFISLYSFLMNYRELIAEAWVDTQANKKLIFWFGFLPSVFTTTFAIGYVIYQFFSFRNSELFSTGENEFLGNLVSWVLTFFQDNSSLVVPLIVVAIIFLIFFLLFPTLAKASAIQMIARTRNGQKCGPGGGLKHGLLSFLPLFEYHLLIRAFTFFAMVTEMLFVLRNLGPETLMFLLPLFVIMVLISLVFTLLFTFADFYIVIDDLGVFESMKTSAKLVIQNLKHTFLVTVLMMVIGIRIVIQAIIVFLIPGLVILIAGYLATVTLAVTGIIVGGLVGLVGLLLAAYLGGIVDVFAYTVWTYAFLDLSGAEELSAREAAAS